ncbi:MAG: transketolase C-terminal domain-containing protein [Candidatus Aenigmatarchaeota archaeon]
MKGELLSSTDAAAFGAKASFVEAVPSFANPFSIEISKKLAKIHQCDIFDVPTAGDAFASALGCVATGKRTFIPASSPLSQDVFSAPFMRLPFVVANVAKSLHGAKTDHASSMALRDAGYLMFFPEGNQEIHDTIIQAYRVAEDQKVLLPAIVNIDGISNFSEGIQPATDAAVRGFLPKFRGPKLDAKNPLYFNIHSDKYDELKLQQQKAMDNATDLLKKTDEKWRQKFRRGYGIVERFMMEDAETIIVIMGYHSSTAKAAAKKMREAGKKVGVLRIRVFRPWPAKLVNEALATAKKVLVFDQAVSIGTGSILAAHLKRSCSSLVSMGKYPSEKDFLDAVARVEKSEHDLKLWL